MRVRDLWYIPGGGAGEILAEEEASPLEALICVIDEGEGGDDQLAGHAAELSAEPLHVLADALVRVINVIPQHVDSVVHAAPEVEAVEVLGEVLPPAYIQQVTGELVKALQLHGGGGKGKGRRGRMAFC